MFVAFPIMKALEKRLASEFGSSRDCLPFRVGGDWLQSDFPQITDPEDLESLAAVSEWISVHSDDFFRPSPAPIEFTTQGHTILFQSRGVTRHDENRTVRLSYAPLAPGCPMVLVLPAWNVSRKTFRKLLPIARLEGFGGASMSMPYHDERMPLGWTHAQPLACADLGLTLRANQQAVLDAMDAVSVLQQLGHRHVVIVGFSIGSGVSVLLDAHDHRPAGVISVLCGSNFADCAWNGISTTYLRAELEKHLDLPMLKRCWRALEFGCYVPRLPLHRRLTRSLLVGWNDHTFPRNNARNLKALYDAYGVDHFWTTLGCGHYTIAYPPHSYRFALWLRHRLQEVGAAIRGEPLPIARIKEHERASLVDAAEMTVDDSAEDPR